MPPIRGNDSIRAKYPLTSKNSPLYFNPLKAIPYQKIKSNDDLVGSTAKEPGIAELEQRLEGKQSQHAGDGLLTLERILPMNGAESLVRTLLASGVDTCFANPGTSEMHFVAALDQVEGMRCILGMAETVVTGCADGYARMAGKPAATLLHCGPGFANGIANVHNARRAHSPMVNIVGDQASYHRPFDAPLTADTEGLARAASHWVRTSASSASVGADGAAAVQAANTAPGQIATLILPADTAWNEGGVVAAPLPVPARPAVALDTLRATAQVLRRKEPAMLILYGQALSEAGLAAANRIAHFTGANCARPPRYRVWRAAEGACRWTAFPYMVDGALKSAGRHEARDPRRREAAHGIFSPIRASPA